MEADCLQQDSDEGVEVGDEGEDGLHYIQAEQNDETIILEADTVYVLMPKNLPISRATRFQWFLDHLNTVITIPVYIKIDNTSTELKIISATSKKESAVKCYQYLITSNTLIKFLAHSYRFVYCFDMSPSQSSVNIEKGEILFDEILQCFKTTIEGLCKQFTINGNSLIFQPSLYLTVIANTPFFMSPAQQVLVKGVKISSQNIQEIISLIENQFYFLEGRIARVSSMAHDEVELQKSNTEGMIGSLFHTTDTEQNIPNIAMVLPDANFVNMLRYSMLAISLLPENSLSHILVVTDGVVAMPDSNIMESLLLQLHYESISVSFLKVGPKFHPRNSAGYISYTDLLHFISQATSGICLEVFPEIKLNPLMPMNIYHLSYLLWTFQSKNKYSCNPLGSHQNKWKIPNSNFQNNKVPVLLSKRQTEDNVTASVSLLLSRRMREGYNIDYVKFDNGLLEISLSIEWKSYIYIQYHMTYQWPMVKNVARVEVRICAPYEFLHDITCLMKKESKSSYRQAVIERFWLRLTQLSSTDVVLAQQLTSMQNTNTWYTLPESVRNGIPVFILEGNDTTKLILLPRVERKTDILHNLKVILPTVGVRLANAWLFIDSENLTYYSTEAYDLYLAATQSDVSCNKFISVWQPLCQIESNNWRKWLHTHKISVVLKYDHPLPRHLHLANSSGRFQIVQCRQAATALYSMLSEWSSFILIDNHTYLKFLYNQDDQHPTWFCIVRVIPKFPCAIINVGFVTGTLGSIRHKVCEDLKAELFTLSYLSSPVKSKDNMCCTLMQKSLERILIRYERMPSDLTTVVFPDGTRPPNALQNLPPSPLAGTLFTTLSRYLYHRRWIWSTSNVVNPKLEMTAISRILSTLTRMRLKEGFSFAHSSSGIITMVLELTMKPLSSCVVQFVLFPPHRAWREGEFTSSSEEDVDPDSETDPELQMVTEVWIEPQYGNVQPRIFRTNYLDNKQYHELADVIRQVDSLCINSLLTLEHLNLICQNKSQSCVMDHSSSSRRSSTINKRRRNCSYRDSRSSSENLFTLCDTEERIEHIPFNFDPISILPLSQQTELLFSMFIENNEKMALGTNYDFEKSNKFLLENIQDHLLCLHDYELDITWEESDRFTEQILVRHQNKYPHFCPLSHVSSRVSGTPTPSDDYHLPQWRCFIKGISVTHVILTFIPTNLKSLKKLVIPEGTTTPSLNDSSESTERASSRESNFSDVPINATNSLVLPLYIYDCPLALLVSSYINNSDDADSSINDIYEDHRFKFGSIIEEDCIRLKSDELLNGSPEPKSDESETSDSKSTVKQHCKALVLAHSKCFVMSLFSALQHGAFVNRSDVQFAMDQCEETVYDVDISYYLETICGHLKQESDDLIDKNILNKPLHCIELKPLHRLVKEKFLEIMNVAFTPIPSNKEYYYCRNLILDKMIMKVDSDDEVSIPQSDGVEFRSSFSDTPYLLHLDSTSSRGSNQFITPLFVHLICTVRYDNNVVNTSVKVLPTCLGELIQNMEFDSQYIKKSKLQISLDIMCLTLPIEVQNVMNDYSTKGFRTTSFCSDGFQAVSIGSAASDASFIPEFPDPIQHLPDVQRRAISNLREEIKLLLRDEIATALLDSEPVTTNILNFVINHVSESSTCTSCVKDIIELNFVYGANQSYEKFMQEFSKIDIPYHRLLKEEDLYYITKHSQYEQMLGSANEILSTNNLDSHSFMTRFDRRESISDKSDYTGVIEENDEIFHKNEFILHQSDMSSIDDSYIGTDGGYDEDVSEDEEDFSWLIQLDNKRKSLPNFWLIMQVEQEAVTIYFHCRFLELPTTLVGTYLQVQRAIRDAIRNLCKKVNQFLLLQSLHDTRACDDLLESEESFKSYNSENNTPKITRNPSFSRLRSMDEVSDEADPYPVALAEASLKFKPGYFSCPVVWETQFILHPRLKTGSGKFSLSRGVLALKNVLDKFSVTNRSNMFVYQDVNSNVFYLRLHENLQNFPKGSKMKSNKFEHTIVSRSPSIASLPLGPEKNTLTQSQQSIASSNSRESDIRPRVRSFGEKEIKDTPNDDTLILKVHGITEVGDDVRCELVQVLQNRLDDAVLECLSVMLARNAMCPLTPEDVHFLQKPFRLPEIVIRLTVQNYALKYLDSFVHYLKQNLLQFLNIPKYTDSRSHYHFKDYSETDQPSSKFMDNMFIYNQSQNPSSGSKGIACIALAVVVQPDQNQKFNGNFTELFQKFDFQNIVSLTKLSDNDKRNGTYIEFRMWKQGRVNTENLFQKLYDTTNQAMWDIIMEYYLLQKPLCEEDSENFRKRSGYNSKLGNSESPIPLNSKEIECSVVLNTNIEEYHRFHKSRQDLQIKKGDCPKVLVSYRHQKKYIPLNSSVRRSILFDDYKDRDSTGSNTKALIPLDCFELGEEGVMTKICSTLLKDWLDFGFDSSVPAVRKHVVTLTNRHLLNVTIKEFQNIITQLSSDTTKVFSCLPIGGLKEGHKEMYLPYNTSDSPNKAILIARNFEQWKICNLNSNPLDHMDLINPQTLKHTQKFIPNISENSFVPRQKFLWALIESDSILIYTYNWSKDNLDKLREITTNIGLWLSVRGSLLNSITSQKLGIFYNQAVARNNLLTSTNPYLSYISDVECMMKYSRDRSRRPPPVGLSSQPMAMLEVFRDTHKYLKPCHADPVVVFVVEMQELKRTDKKYKDELKKLHSMWQSRTSTCTSIQIQTLKQNSRVIHFCHTPLLFLSEWRINSAATRDHSLSPPLIYNELNIDRRYSEDVENWYKNLCHGFISEYKHYLQTLGFIPLQIENSHKKHSHMKSESNSYNSVFYVQKTILGGILIFKIYLNEPFLITKLHAIECSKLQSTTSRTSINQFTVSFLDECDKVKVAMHLHSFTYDFHLRCIHNYIANISNGIKVCDGYHLTHFLDDFMKYYNKAPNFARNLVHEETITIMELMTEGKQLFDYLLSNVSQYNMDVFSMHGENEEECEYVLVHISHIPQVSYKDSQDCKHSDDFDVTLIVTRTCFPYESWETVLHLKFYIILTSRSEVYPTSDIDRTLGKFRTVSSTYRSLSTPKENTSEDHIADISKFSQSEIDSDIENAVQMATLAESKDDINSQKSVTTLHSHEEKSRSYSGHNHSHVEIKKESVNYLGYYSSHEQLMQQLILQQATLARNKIKEMVAQGMVDCRTHLLWNKLVSPHEANQLTYGEFIELKNLAKLQNLCDIHPNLSSLLINQPITWYQGLSKLLLVKYNGQNRSFISPDGNIQHSVILHPRYDGAFMLLSMDVHTSRGNLYAVYRASHKHQDSDICMTDRKALLDGFINCICFYIWTGLI